MQRRLRFTTLAAIAAAGLATSGLAQAQAQPAVYVQVGAGPSDFNQDCTGVSNCDDSDTAVVAIGGLRFGSGLAAEALVTRFGEARGSALGVEVRAKADAVGAGGAFHVNFAPNVAGVVRLGLASVKVKADGRSGPLSASLSDRSTQLYAGFGLSYAFTPRVYIEGGYLATRGKLEGEKSDLNALTASVGFRF